MKIRFSKNDVVDTKNLPTGESVDGANAVFDDDKMNAILCAALADFAQYHSDYVRETIGVEYSDAVSYFNGKMYEFLDEASQASDAL